jgi:hypothetical protein
MRRSHQTPALMVELMLLVMVITACSSPAPNGTSQGGPTHATSTAAQTAGREFISKRYGFEVTAPKTWYNGDAQVAWDGKETPDLELQTNPYYAYVADSANDDRKFAVTAAPVAKGMRLAAWQATVGSIVGRGCVAGSVTKTTLGGEPALTWTEDCGRLRPTPIVAVHGGRGYLAIAELTPPDPRIRASILRSFHFTG